MYKERWNKKWTETREGTNLTQSNIWNLTGWQVIIVWEYEIKRQDDLELHLKELPVENAELDNVINITK